MSEEADNFGAGEVPLFIVLIQVILAVIIITENVILIYLVFKNDVLHTTSYFFITSLGVADLAVGILDLVGALYYLVVFYPTSGVTTLTTTIYICLAIGMSMLSYIHMAVISVERYVYIAHPFHHQKYMTFPFIAKVIAAIWTMGAVYTAFITFAQVNIFYIKTLPESHMVLKLGAIVSVYSIATTVTAVSYSLIMRVVCHKRRSVSSVGFHTGSAARWSVTAKSLKFFVSVFGIYFVTTFPAMFDMFFHDIQIPSGVRYVLLPLFIANSGSNFPVLLVVDRTFREILLKRFTCILALKKTCQAGSDMTEVSV